MSIFKGHDILPVIFYSYVKKQSNHITVKKHFAKNGNAIRIKWFQLQLNKLVFSDAEGDILTL